MTQPDPSQRRGPKRRADSTRPPTIRSRTRRGGDRRPYPSAPTRTRPSPAKAATTRSRSRGSASTPTPATVWACGLDPIDLDATWPTPVVSKTVTSFSQPGGRVVLLPWPTVAAKPSALVPVGSDAVIGRVPGAERDDELADALAVIDEADRIGRIVRVNPDSAAAGPPSRPFWADLVNGPDHAPTATTDTPRAGLGGVLDGVEAAPGAVDLIITSLRPDGSGDRASDLVALLAARLLRVGGILTVLTHCDWSRGELVDPTGAVVAAGQNADLLYLQHIVALHAPVRDGHFALGLGQPAFDEYARTQHRAVVRKLPSPHRRIHSDVLVFAQPRDHQPPSLAPVDAAFETGVIR